MLNPQERLNQLQTYNSRSTCMISYILTPNTDLKLAYQKILKELTTVSNIKNKTVRKNVTDALIAIKNNIPVKQKFPNGIAIYSGWCV